MMIFKKYSWIKAVPLILILGVTGFLINHCVDGSSSTEIGVFKNNAIDGLGYVTVPGGLCGKTNEKGEFLFKENDNITFFIGNIKLGGGAAKPQMTTLDLVPGADDIQNPEVVNIARLLQSLDTKQQVDEIEIPKGIEDVVDSWLISLAGEEFGFDPSDCNFDLMAKDLCAYLEAQMAVYSSGLDLVNEGDAVDHMTETLLSSYSGVYCGNSPGDDSDG